MAILGHFQRAHVRVVRNTCFAGAVPPAATPRSKYGKKRDGHPERERSGMGQPNDVDPAELSHRDRSPVSRGPVATPYSLARFRIE